MLDRAYNIGARAAYSELMTKLSGSREIADPYESDTEISDSDPVTSSEDGKAVARLLAAINSFQVGEPDSGLGSHKGNKRKRSQNGYVGNSSGPAINKREQWSHKVQINRHGY